MRERSAPTPIIFGPLFEVHSGPADGVKFLTVGGGEDSGLLPLGAAGFHTVDCMLHLSPTSPGFLR